MGIGESVIWGGREYRIWRAQFEGKSIGILMGIGESVTWGVWDTVSGRSIWREIYRNTYGNTGIGNLGGGIRYLEVNLEGYL